MTCLIGYIIRMKKKAEEIRRRSPEERRKTKNEQKKRGSFISIPNSQHAETIASSLRSAGPGSNFAITSGKKIDSLIRTKNKKSETKSVVYKIPCSGSCMKTCIEETGRGLDVRLKEHKRDVRNHDTKKRTCAPHWNVWKLARLGESGSNWKGHAKICQESYGSGAHSCKWCHQYKTWILYVGESRSKNCTE